MNQMNKKDILLAVMVILLWGVNFYFIRLGVQELSPMVLGLLRFVCLLVPAVFIIKRPAVAWYWLVLYGLTISFGQFTLLFWAIWVGMPTGIVALIHQSQAFFTVLIAYFLWQESLKVNHLLAMILAGVGLALVGVGQYQGKLPMMGLLLTLAAALSWAVGNVVVKKVGQVNALSLVIWGNVITVLLFAVASMALHGMAGVVQQIEGMTWRGWLSVGFLAYVAGLMGYASWGSLLARYPAGTITPLALLIPIIALMVAYFALKEPLNGWHWLGSAVVMMALVVQVFGGRWFKRGQVNESTNVD